EWHPHKNGDVLPEMVSPGSGTKRWWKCDGGADHEYRATPSARKRGGGCPFCTGKRASVTNSLASLYPDIAAEWHPVKNGELTPSQLVAGSSKDVWWACQTCGHEWAAKPIARTRRGQGCPYCPSVAYLLSEIANQWHPTKNGDLTPAQFTSGSSKSVWWKCDKGPDHEWEAPPKDRSRGHGCPCCSGNRVSVTNSLVGLYPDVAKQWHPTRNGNLLPSHVLAGSNTKRWWKCGLNPDHEWEATNGDRTALGSGCPYCTLGWTVDKIRLFVRSIRAHLTTFTPAELYLLFQQNGMLATQGKGKSFVDALASGRFPEDEIDRFLGEEPSLVDQFISDDISTLEEIRLCEVDDERKGPRKEETEAAEDLPIASTTEVLAALDQAVITTGDEDAVSFFVTSATAKIWKNAFRNENKAVAESVAYRGDHYSDEVRSNFLKEYDAAKALPIPAGYSFTAGGSDVAWPNLMQRLVAIRVRDNRRIGNWSGTGAGKTLSAILAGRVIGAGLTVICCPNSVVDGWENAILEAYPDSLVETKTFSPHWNRGDDIGFGKIAISHRYLILNYESFQQRDSPSRVSTLLANEQIDFIVVDEIHFTKQRRAENISRRKKVIGAMIAGASETYPDLAVLGMSATPVINNLFEGKSLVEMITGVEHDDLKTTSTVANCMSLHQRLMTLGIRWKPDYRQTCNIIEQEVDCSDYVDDIRQLGRTHSPLDLEKILTKARLPAILENVRPKTLIYTNYVTDIDRDLREALEAAGWKTGFYTGEDKSGLIGFIEGDIDVLIGSSAIGTGVDGLQRVCNRLIINVLPWTHAEYEQLLGRIHRQGQVKDLVEVIIPLTYAEVGGERWSWCESKMQRIRFKKSIADAAVDGVVPEGHLRTPAQAYRDVIGWLERLERGETAVIERRRIVVPLPDDDNADVEKRLARYGDFSKMNQRWNASKSTKTFERLEAAPEEWEQYHSLYRNARENWTVVPFDEIIEWCQRRKGYVIGDFGCGEAQLAAALSDRHVVHSFDHVAINDAVVACDMAHTPLEDAVLDVAVFSLSLMGSNFSDYIREAHRTLKIDGHLHIVEATSRFEDPEAFAASLSSLGFDVIDVRDLWKFTYIRAIKADREIVDDARLSFSVGTDSRS
ncbi:DEAD/DEAH box helicase family protein, partial [Rhodothermus sp. AH-315-K08]|nr:DEAD/DEAH box helicase family protein [Rhodothermus sp. AH-315-K08]